MSVFIDSAAAGGEHANALRDVLSPTAEIFYPNSTEFNSLSARWSTLAQPKVNVAVVPFSDDDVVKIVSILWFSFRRHFLLRFSPLLVIATLLSLPGHCLESDTARTPRHTY